MLTKTLSLSWILHGIPWWYLCALILLLLFSIVTFLEFCTQADKNLSTEENVIVGVSAEKGGGVIIICVAVSLRTVCLKYLQHTLMMFLYINVYSVHLIVMLTETNSVHRLRFERPIFCVFIWLPQLNWLSTNKYTKETLRQSANVFIDGVS